MKTRITTILIIFLLCFSNCKEDKAPLEVQKNDISTFYFIRHAEKDRSDKTNRNPHLTEIGQARANHWGIILNNIKFDAVYSTDYNRTRETAMPVAKQNNLELTIYEGNNLHGEKLKASNIGKTVLVVGHSDTTPKFVNSAINKQKYSAIDDSNNGNLYIVTVSGNSVIDQVLKINPR